MPAAALLFHKNERTAQAQNIFSDCMGGLRVTANTSDCWARLREPILTAKLMNEVMMESIYNLIPKEEVKPQKEKRHTSKFKDTVLVEEKQHRAPAKTMGVAEVQKPQPDAFLKKHSKEPQLPAKEEFKYPDAERKRPPVPTVKDEKPLMGLKTTKNFIAQNAVENIMAIPKKPAKKFVDTKVGDTQKLTPSGMEPVYVSKKEYGEVPTYLKNRKDEVQRAQEEYDAYVAENFRRGSMKQLSAAEVESILKGLKANWADLYHQYQGLSVVIDTLPKKHRKERLENEMKQLERDIQTLEKHSVIYISS